MAKGDSASPMAKSFGNSANMQPSGNRPMGMGRGMYDSGATPRPQIQENRNMMNPNTQMGNQFSQMQDMTRSHAMNTGQMDKYTNFQNAFQGGQPFLDFMKQFTGGNPGKMPDLPMYGQGGGSAGYMPNQPPPQPMGNDMRANVEQQAQLPSYGIQAQGGMIQGPGGFNRQMGQNTLPGRRY